VPEMGSEFDEFNADACHPRLVYNTQINYPAADFFFCPDVCKLYELSDLNGHPQKYQRAVYIYDESLSFLRFGSIVRLASHHDFDTYADTLASARAAHLSGLKFQNGHCRKTLSSVLSAIVQETLSR
jgi:hypothetical protein